MRNPQQRKIFDLEIGLARRDRELLDGGFARGPPDLLDLGLQLGLERCEPRSTRCRTT
jgi:hypothetical protein